MKLWLSFTKNRTARLQIATSTHKYPIYFRHERQNKVVFTNDNHCLPLDGRCAWKWRKDTPQMAAPTGMTVRF